MIYAIVALVAYLLAGGLLAVALISSESFFSSVQDHTHGLLYRFLLILIAPWALAMGWHEGAFKEQLSGLWRSFLAGEPVER